MNSSERGQATVEYIFILAFAVFLGVKLTGKFSNFFSDSLGRVGHVLSSHLMVGICPKNCYYEGYKNSYRGQ